MKVSRLVLASESARRVNLLDTAGYEFEAHKSGFPELLLEDPIKTVRANAKGKALAVAKDPDSVVLAADTVVYLPDLPMHDRIFGQARNKEDVRRFLDKLQGRSHEVYTGVAVARGEDLTLRHAVTSVRMRVLGSAEVESYAHYGEGIGKAGDTLYRDGPHHSSSGSEATTRTLSAYRSPSQVGCSPTQESPTPERAVRKTSSP